MPFSKRKSLRFYDIRHQRFLFRITKKVFFENASNPMILAFFSRGSFEKSENFAVCARECVGRQEVVATFALQ